MTSFEAQARELLQELVTNAHNHTATADSIDFILRDINAITRALSQLHESEMRNQTDKVTRFEVIDHSEGGTGRDFVKYGVKVELSLQDDDRTLKVFLTPQSKEDVRHE